MINSCQCCCFVHFRNTSILLSLALLAVYLLIPEIDDAIIVYSCKVLQIFYRHLNHKCKFTKVTGNTLHVHF